MTVLTRTKHRWDTLECQRIVSASSDGDTLVVGFEDGTRQRLAVSDLESPHLRNPDWAAVTHSSFDISLPTADGDVEISWFSIRALTDPQLSTHLDIMAAESALSTGSRIRALREARNVGPAELAAQAGISLDLLTRVEAGQERAALEVLARVLRPLGCSLRDLSAEPESSR